MDLGDALDTVEAVKPQVVSTGKNPVVDFEYDKTKADLAAECTLAKTLPYVARAIEYINGLGFSVESILRQALVRRANGEKVLTVHEADIAYRKKMDMRSPLLIEAIMECGCFMTEDDAAFSSGVFQARARYNKGMQWYKDSYSKATPQQKTKGLRSLEGIRNELKIIGLPMHDEEIADSFHIEFLKPESLSWQLFTHKINAANACEPIEMREERMARQADSLASVPV